MSPVYDHPAVSATYFFPRPCGPLPAVDGAGPVELTDEEGARLGGYWIRTLAGAPTLLYLYGNGEIAADQLYHWPGWAAGGIDAREDYDAFLERIASSAS